MFEMRSHFLVYPQNGITANTIGNPVLLIKQTGPKFIFCDSLHFKVILTTTNYC